MVHLEIEEQPDGTGRLVVRSPLADLASAAAFAGALESLFVDHEAAQEEDK